MVRSILPLIILASVFLLQGLAPKVRTVRERQLEQMPLIPCTESWMATAAAIQTGLPHPWGCTHRGHRTGQSSVVCNSVSSVDRVVCRSTKAKGLRCTKLKHMLCQSLPYLQKINQQFK